MRWGDKLANPYQQLFRASGYAFYNTSKYDFEHLLKDAPNLADNLRNYISGFSPNMREVLEKFDIGSTIAKLDDAGLLFKVMERFKAVDLHPDKVPNYVMGSIFEELIRKFNEALDENPGEHFTPREVVRLMVALLLSHDEDELSRPRVAREVAPYVPDAWININVRDEQDGEVGRVGYEINFNRYFYRYQPPRPLEEIERDIRVVEAEILEMLREALV